MLYYGFRSLIALIEFVLKRYAPRHLKSLKHARRYESFVFILIIIFYFVLFYFEIDLMSGDLVGRPNLDPVVGTFGGFDL